MTTNKYDESYKQTAPRPMALIRLGWFRPDIAFCRYSWLYSAMVKKQSTQGSGLRLLPESRLIDIAFTPLNTAEKLQPEQHTPESRVGRLFAEELGAIEKVDRDQEDIAQLFFGIPPRL